MNPHNLRPRAPFFPRKIIQLGLCLGSFPPARSPLDHELLLQLSPSPLASSFRSASLRPNIILRRILFSQFQYLARARLNLSFSLSTRPPANSRFIPFFLLTSGILSRSLTVSRRLLFQPRYQDLCLYMGEGKPSLADLRL